MACADSIFFSRGDLSSEAGNAAAVSDPSCGATPLKELATEGKTA